MNSQLTDEFVACFARLPEAIKTQARKNYRLWRQNSAHPSLHFKKVHAQQDVYSIRIGQGWRALGLLEGDTMTWFWIGSHAEYDAMLG